MHAASKGLADTLKSDKRLTPGASYLIFLSASVIELPDKAGVCLIVDGSGYDLSISRMALTFHEICGLRRRLLHLDFAVGSFYHEILYGLISAEGYERVLKNARNVLVSQPRLAKVPYLRFTMAWSSVLRQASEYIYHPCAVSMPTQFPDFPVLVLVLYSLTTPTESVLADVVVPTDSTIETVPDMPRMRKVVALVSAAVAVPIDTMPMMADFISPVQPSDGLTRPVPPSLSPALGSCGFCEFYLSGCVCFYRCGF